jgi:hypothetical protein
MNIRDIPPTVEAIRNLSPSVRYRVAMQVGAVPSSQDAVSSYSGMPLEEQIGLILPKLIEFQTTAGQAPPMVAPPPMMRQPDPIQQPMQAAPQQLGAPSQMQRPQQLGAPSQMAPQQLGAQMAAPPMRMPVPATDPGVASSQAAVATSSLLAIAAKLDKIEKAIDDEVPGHDTMEELQGSIMGIATTMNTLVIIGLLILERVHNDELPADAIYAIIREHLNRRTSEQLMLALKGTPSGK